jgi:nucleotide-binding universal stress UspA family protein
VLFESGRPILLFPTETCAGIFDRIAIAWDGTPTLARALTGARPFLARSAKVVLVSVTDDKEINTQDRDRFATILRNAGLTVEIISSRANGESAAVTIQTVAAENDANLLVAGAFGHSRFREFILGGVTRSLLSDLPMPTLLSH